MQADRRAYLLIVAARSLSEAVALSVLAALLHGITVGRDQVPLVAMTSAVFGATLVLAALLRERGTVRQSAGLVGVVMVGWVAWSLAQPARSPDVVAVLTRVVGFAILGEVHVWRVLGIARGLQRWREVRNAALFALGTIVVATLGPPAVDRGALPPLALAVACASAVALSLARAAEELALSTGQVRGRPTGSSASGTAFALGLLALALAFALPSIEAAVGAAARAIGPLLSAVLTLLLLPLGYLAAYIVSVILWLRDRIRARPDEEPPAPVDIAGDLERLREMEQIRPYVFGAVEVLIGLIALLLAVALVLRLVEERRARLAEGVTLAREHVEGIGLQETLRRLFARPSRRPGPPPDDGTPASVLRRLYWRLLEVAEREGPGWRAPAETPAEHEDRLAAAAPRWREAGPLVRAFESLRYGERDPDPATVAAAREALLRVEAVR